MINRLKELKQDSMIKSDLEENLLEEDKENPVLTKIMELFKNSKANIAKIEENLKLLDELTEAVINCVDKETEKMISLSMKKIMENNMSYVNENKKLLDYVKKITETKTESLEENDYVLIDQNFMALINKNKTCLELSLKKDIECKNKIKQKVKRQLIAISDDVEEKQIDEILQDTAKTETFIKQKIIGHPNFQIINNLQDIKNKYDDIVLLEKNIKEINMIINQIGELAKEQTEHIHVIDKNFKTLNVAVNQANVHLKKAVENEKSSLKKRCCLLLMIILTFFILFGPILISILFSNGIL